MAHKLSCVGQVAATGACWRIPVIPWLASLADPALAQTDVALLLGYTEQSSFIRAFRSWTGMTPGEYRAHLSHPSGRSPMADPAY